MQVYLRIYIMKCPSCHKNMTTISTIIKEDNIPFEAHRCTSCKEDVMDMHQLKDLAAKYRELRKAKEITFTK